MPRVFHKDRQALHEYIRQDYEQRLKNLARWLLNHFHTREARAAQLQKLVDKKAEKDPVSAEWFRKTLTEKIYEVWNEQKQQAANQ